MVKPEQSKPDGAGACPHVGGPQELEGIADDVCPGRPPRRWRHGGGRRRVGRRRGVLDGGRGASRRGRVTGRRGVTGGRGAGRGGRALGGRSGRPGRRCCRRGGSLGLEGIFGRLLGGGRQCRLLRGIFLLQLGYLGFLALEGLRLRRQLILDLLLGRRHVGDVLLLALQLLGQVGLAGGDFVVVRGDLGHQVAVLFAQPLHETEPVDEVGEGGGADEGVQARRGGLPCRSLQPAAERRALASWRSASTATNFFSLS